MSFRRSITPGRNHGFSLVELVFVVAIISILSAIALPHWSGVSKSYQLNLAAKRLASDLLYAETIANHSSTSVTVSFNWSAGTYQLVGMTDPDRPSQPYIVNLSSSPYGVTIQTASLGNQLVFDGYGSPAQSGSIIVSIGGTQKNVLVDAVSGRVAIQ